MAFDTLEQQDKKQKRVRALWSPIYASSKKKLKTGME